MGQFRDYLETGKIDEARDKSVSPEFRIAMGILKRLYNPKEVPEKNKLKDDAEDVAKKYKLDIKTFVKYALDQYGLNEASRIPITWLDAKQAAKDAFNVLKKEGFIANQKSEHAVRLKHKNGCVGQLVFDPHLNEESLDEANKKLLDAKYQLQTNQIFNKSNIEHMLKIANKIENTVDKSTLINYLDLIKEYDIKDTDKVKLVLEAAVGQKGRTSYKEAMDYCEENEELVDEFRKIIKKLGGKTVAKALLDKLSQKPEIKDEIEHIEDIIDNSNY